MFLYIVAMAGIGRRSCALWQRYAWTRIIARLKDSWSSWKRNGAALGLCHRRSLCTDSSSQIVVATSPSLPETLLERVALLRAVLEMLLLCLRLNKEEKRWGSFFLRGSRVSGNRQVYILLIRKSREAFASSNSDLPSSHKTSEKTRVNLLAPKEVSPIFTQFLDSVYQIWIQYPS